MLLTICEELIIRDCMRHLNIKACSFIMSPFNVILLLAIYICNNEAAKILAVFPMPCISHQIVFRPYIQELLARGHEVVVITADPAYNEEQTPRNLTEISVHDVSYELWTNYIKTVTKKIKNNDQHKFIENYINVFIQIFEKQAQTAKVQDIIEQKVNTFDLILVEACARFALGFSHIINAPVIEISSFGVPYFNYESLGAPTHPLLYPYPNDITTPFNELPLWKKLRLYYNFYSILNQYNVAEILENSVTRKVFGKNSPAINELHNNVQKLLLNIHPVWEGIRPVPPGVVYMGGLYQDSKLALPLDLKHYLDSSRDGVIYMSFGTNVDLSKLPKDKIKTIVTVFSRMPYDILWKWDKPDELPELTKNIKIFKWLPQSILLKHPKIKLFITHGGLQSTDEALTAGVPLIGIPMFVDQWFNTKKYEYHKIGLQLTLQTLDVDRFTNAITKVIGDKSYRENILLLKTVMDDRPISSLELAVWCTENVLLSGKNYTWYLRAPAANMHWTVYFEVELVFIILSIIIATFIAALLIIRSMVKLVFKLLKYIARRSHINKLSV